VTQSNRPRNPSLVGGLTHGGTNSPRREPRTNRDDAEDPPRTHPATPFRGDLVTTAINLVYCPGDRRVLISAGRAARCSCLDRAYNDRSQGHKKDEGLQRQGEDGSGFRKIPTRRRHVTRRAPSASPACEGLRPTLSGNGLNELMIAVRRGVVRMNRPLGNSVFDAAELVFSASPLDGGVVVAVRESKPADQQSRWARTGRN